MAVIDGGLAPRPRLVFVRCHISCLVYFFSPIVAFQTLFFMLNGGMKDWSYRGIELLLNFEYCPFRISLMDQMLEFPDFSESGSTAAGSAGAGHSLMRILAVYCYVLCHPTIDLIMNTSSPPPDFFTHEEAACPHCPLQHE